MTPEQSKLRDALKNVLHYLARRDEADCDVRDWAKEFLSLGVAMRSLGIAESWRQETLPMETDRSVLQAIWLAANVTGEDDKRRFTALVDVLRGVMDSPSALRYRFRDSLVNLMQTWLRDGSDDPFDFPKATKYAEFAQ